jgi:hypothetical protein
MSPVTVAAATARSAVVAASAGLLVIASFQAALALGAPLGRAAWGGTRTHLPTRLRIASAVAVVFWMLAASIVLARAGFEVSPIPDTVVRWGTWVLVGVLPIGALMNFVSSSPWERFFWGPLALLLAVLCFVLARS